MRISPAVRSFILSYRLKFLSDPLTSPQLTLNDYNSKNLSYKNKQTNIQTDICKHSNRQKDRSV